MAYSALESVRQAEIKAQEQIDSVQKKADLSVSDAKDTAAKIISDAKEKADLKISHDADKASLEADEIIITAKNKALLDAEQLKNDALSKQDAVNKAILELII